MRLRLFERLGRLVSWRFGSQRAGAGRAAQSRAAGPEAGGRHRRNAGRAQPQSRAAGGPRASQAAPPLQPPAGLPTTRAAVTGGRDEPAHRRPSATLGRPGRRPGHAATAAELHPGRWRWRWRRHRAGADQGGAIRRGSTRHGGTRTWRRKRPGRRCRGASAGTRPSAGPGRRVAAAALVPGDRRSSRGPAPYRAGGRGAAAQVPPGQTAAQPARNGSAAGLARRRQPAARCCRWPPPHPHGYPVTADGRRNCGPLERILWRQWDAATTAPPPAGGLRDRPARGVSTAAAGEAGRRARRHLRGRWRRTRPR